MSEYKRLTRRNEDGTTLVKCADCYIQDKCDFTKETCCEELQDRLAELEDKIENGEIGDINAERHRMKVLERALDKATELAYEYRNEQDTLSCSSCPMFDYGIFDSCKERGLYKECSKRWKEQLIHQAEKELQEGKK